MLNYFVKYILKDILKWKKNSTSIRCGKEGEGHVLTFKFICYAPPLLNEHDT